MSEKCPHCGVDAIDVKDLEQQPLAWPVYKCGSRDFPHEDFMQSDACKVAALSTSLKRAGDVLKWEGTPRLTEKEMPPVAQAVFVAGGLAIWDGVYWRTLMDRDKPVIQWDVKWWIPLIWDADVIRYRNAIDATLADITRVLGGKE